MAAKGPVTVESTDSGGISALGHALRANLPNAAAQPAMGRIGIKPRVPEQ